MVMLCIEEIISSSSEQSDVNEEFPNISIKGHQMSVCAMWYHLSTTFYLLFSGIVQAIL